MTTDILQGMLNRALAKQYHATTKAAPARGKSSADQKPIHGTRAFQDPERWKKVRTLALIHTAGESQTLIGNFHEFLHDSMTARKLVRVTEPCSTEGVEYVTGALWLDQEQEDHAAPEKWIETVERVIGITLKDLRLHCPDAFVTVRLEFGGIARVELNEVTRFTCPERDTFLFLPKGLDVLTCMTLDSKLALRSEVGE